MSRIKVGLYGMNGHQIDHALKDHPTAEVVALAALTSDEIPDHLRSERVRVYSNLEWLLADPEVQLISFCSPLRVEQGGHIIRCLEAGKHAYAEKPCCLSEAELDRIIRTSRRTGRVFHEMADTAFMQPYCTLRAIVAGGVIGDVIQVVSQKSYPWGDWRPGDERVDGGLARQAGVYNARFAEHVAGVRIKSMLIRETRLGNDHPGSACCRAVSFLMEFENGGVGSAVANYCCPSPPSWRKWGYEILRIFGSKGFVESMDGGRLGTLVVEGRDPQTLDFSESGQNYLGMVLHEIADGRKVIPFTLEEELSPTRWVIRAKAG